MKRRNFGEVKKVMKLWESTLANNVFSFFLIFLPQLTFTYDLIIHAKKKTQELPNFNNSEF